MTTWRNSYALRAWLPSKSRLLKRRQRRVREASVYLSHRGRETGERGERDGGERDGGERRERWRETGESGRLVWEGEKKERWG